MVRWARPTARKVSRDIVYECNKIKIFLWVLLCSCKQRQCSCVVGVACVVFLSVFILHCIIRLSVKEANGHDNDNRLKNVLKSASQFPCIPLLNETENIIFLFIIGEIVSSCCCACIYFLFMVENNLCTTSSRTISTL